MKAFRRLWKTIEDFERLRTEDTRRLWKLLNDYENFYKILEGSKRFQKVPKGSKNYVRDITPSCNFDVLEKC